MTLPWFGELPNGWGHARIKSRSRIVNGSTPRNGEADFWNGEIVWVTPDDLGKQQGAEIRDSARHITPAGLNSCGTSLVPSGSIVVSTRAPIGHLGIAQIQLCTNQGCRSIVPLKESSSRYFYYLLAAARPELSARGRGSTFTELSSSDLGDVPIPFPPLPTQKAIADYLDDKAAAIDVLIEKKREFLDLLAEERAALINQAVTKGLDPTVPLKNSGIPWIGEIPAHWRAVQVRRTIQELCDGPFGSGLKSQHYVDAGVRVIRLQNIRSGNFDGSNEAYISEKHFLSLLGHEALPGDLLIAGLGDSNNPVGRACVLPESVPRALVKADCYRARLNPELVHHSFVAEFFSSTSGTTGMLYLSRGATRTRINLEVVRDAWLPLPPLQEQLAILERCETLRCETTRLAITVKDQINRLQEYRQALIAAAVTGQLDIGAAA